MKSSLKWTLLFVLVLALLAIDLLIPDPIPIIDEAILGLLAFLTGQKSLQ